jgi:hypothetical protein
VVLEGLLSDESVVKGLLSMLFVVVLVVEEEEEEEVWVEVCVELSRLLWMMVMLISSCSMEARLVGLAGWMVSSGGGGVWCMEVGSVGCMVSGCSCASLA